ncbi:MoCF-biosynth domain-containing protein [Favolaschia claudopus]|uniref:MoCF-biosynth domain-containing protein n=1 Tax=Favolaschia claudopus TaxID=2862362 RepID=A0AAV9ZLY1_9AGAR
MRSVLTLIPKTRNRSYKTCTSGLSSPLTRPGARLLDPHTTRSASGQNPLGEGNYIRTAAALIIGDEILNGKTHDMNSNYFAKYCFEHGIELKRIEVIADDEAQIIEASRRMVMNYDFVVTSGGIGPTHDITYASLAKAFSQSLVHHTETLTRMTEMIKHRAWMSVQTPQQRAATERMALFPDGAEVLFVAKDIWVPVVRLEGKLLHFPGHPLAFPKMLTALTPLLPLPPQRNDQYVGSYPVLGQGVFVSLIGRDRLLTTASMTSTQVQLDSDGHHSSEDTKDPLG